MGEAGASEPSPWSVLVAQVRGLSGELCGHLDCPGFWRHRPQGISERLLECLLFPRLQPAAPSTGLLLTLTVGAAGGH